MYTHIYIYTLYKCINKYTKHIDKNIKKKYLFRYICINTYIYIYMYVLTSTN